MTIYVDHLQTHHKVNPMAKHLGDHWAHLATDGNVQELHDFAERLGLKREWFQDRPGLPHYDVTPNKQAAAIKAGAILVSAEELLIRCHTKYRGKDVESMVSRLSSKSKTRRTRTV